MARRILRGGIYWAKLDPTHQAKLGKPSETTICATRCGVEQQGTRPVLVVSIDSFNQNSKSAIAFAITSKKPRVKYPLIYQLPEDLLPKPSWVKITQIRTLSIERLGKCLAKIEEEDYQKVMAAFNRICC